MSTVVFKCLLGLKVTPTLGSLPGQKAKSLPYAVSVFFSSCSFSLFLHSSFFSFLPSIPFYSSFYSSPFLFSVSNTYDLVLPSSTPLAPGSQRKADSGLNEHPQTSCQARGTVLKSKWDSKPISVIYPFDDSLGRLLNLFGLWFPHLE